ncbi:MAG TPA: PAS domain S-box protein [Pirellulales bacterium]|nr:PAS domain S-box protein [Pirellulales bacterium]
MKRLCNRLGLPLGSTIGLLAIVLVVLAEYSFVEVNLHRISSNESRLIELQAQLELLLNLRGLLRDAESALRGFVIFGEAEDLERFHVAVGRIDDATARLDRLAADHVVQRAQLALLRQAIDARVAELQSATVARQSGGLEAARQSIAAERERRLMSEIRYHVAEIRRQKEAALAAGAADSRRSAQLAAATDGIGPAIGVGLVGLAFVLFRRDFRRERSADETSRRLAAIVESSEDAIIGETIEGIVTNWNAGATQIFGYRAEEMLGQPTARLLPPPLLPEAREDLSSAVHRIHVEQRESKRLTKDGRVIDVSLTACPIKDPAGKVIGIASIVRDITEQKALEREVLDIAGREQRRIGQDLHDGTGQELTGLAMLSQRLAAMLEEKCAPEAKMAAKIADGLDDALRRVRILSRGLVPVQLDREGLMAALADLAARTSDLHDVVCTFQCTVPVCIPNNDVATNLYRMSQEAVTNAVKHGSAKHICISLAVDGDRITLKVADDGLGLKPSAETAAFGMGLRIMRYRAQLIGAKLEVVPVHCGTEVRCCFNCRRMPDGSCEPADYLSDPVNGRQAATG